LRVTETSAREVNAIPDESLEALARCLFPAIRSYFESEEGQREFAEWQARKNTENLSGREAEPDEQVRLAG